MRKTITTRHCDIPEALRDRAEAVLGRFEALAPRPTDAALVFDVLHGQASVEALVHASGGDQLVARAEADDHRTALDRVEAKMRRQLERVAKRPLAHRAPAPDRV